MNIIYKCFIRSSKISINLYRFYVFLVDLYVDIWFVDAIVSYLFQFYFLVGTNISNKLSTNLPKSVLIYSKKNSVVWFHFIYNYHQYEVDFFFLK